MTLTEFSFYSRKYSPFLIVFVLVILILFYSFKLLFLYLQINQPKNIYTNTVFGKIKKLQVTNTSSSAGLNFTIDTIDGQPIVATESAEIYFLPPSVSRIKFLQQIYLMAKAAGFNTEVTKHTLINNSDAVFADDKQKMTINIADFNFTYEYELKKLDQGFFSGVRGINDTGIESKASGFLNSIGRYPEELAQGKNNTTFYYYDSAMNELKPVDSAAEANMVKVDFYRPDIQALPAPIPYVSSQYFSSQNYVLMAYGNQDYKVIKAQVKFYPKSSDQVGIYPLKSGNTAWEELKNGKGMIVFNSSGKNIVIKKMFLGYYDPDSYQEYLQPVFVFLGENNFVAYVPAVDDKYVE
jgi:hypothetical protein